MIYRYTFLASLTAVGVLMLFAAASVVRAQDLPMPKIGVVDVQKVLRDSKAAKSIRPEFERMRKAFQKQVSEQEQRLRQVEQELTRQRAILAPEAFSRKRKAFSEEARKAQRSVQQRRRQLDKAFNQSKNVILKNLVIVAEKVAEAKNLNLLMEKRHLFLSAKTMDITKEILTRLDKRLPKLALTVGTENQGAGSGKK